MIIDLFLMAVGWVLVTAAAVAQVRRSPGVTLGHFAARQQRNSASRRDWQSAALVAVGFAVAAFGGADGQRHYIGYWALPSVFVPMILAEIVVVAVHNSRLKPHGSMRG